MKAKHRAEITGARVKIDQLTGAAGTLRDTAGSAAEEVKLLLNQVTELRDANKALQQQHALEVSKVLAVKQEMLSLDEQHRRYVKDAEERFTQAELDTEKHFTADREQLLKSHQRLVDAMEKRHNTKSSILEDRMATLQSDWTKEKDDWESQTQNFEAIIADLRQQLAERKKKQAELQSQVQCCHSVCCLLNFPPDAS